MVTDANILPILAVILMSYLLGSIPSAYLIAKARNINIFEVGSGNMGGTNVARAMGGIRWGVLTVICDALKSIVAVTLAWIAMPNERWTAFTISSVVAVAGHNWSLFATMIATAMNKGKLSIRGGKGGASAFGTMLMVVPAPTIVGMLAVGVFLALKTRYVSLGVLASFLVAIIWIIILVAQKLMPVEVIPYTLMIGTLIAWRFRENIQRLLTGTERRLGDAA